MHALPRAVPSITAPRGGIPVSGATEAGAGGRGLKMALLKREVDTEMLLRLIPQPPFQYLSQKTFLACSATETLQ